MATEEPLIRGAEPADAAGVSALLGRTGVFEGTLQMPDAALASRLEHLQRVEFQGCRLVAADAAGHIVGWAALHQVQASLRPTCACSLSPSRRSGRGAASHAG